MKPRFITTALSLILVAASNVASASAQSVRTTTRQPNIIFILADDLGYGDLGSYGQKKIRTPALDRLSAEGMRFTQFYSGSPVCAPSRCVLMTGKGKQRKHEFLFWDFNGYGGQQAVRMGDWKGVRKNLHSGNTKIELYNLAEDIGEKRDVAAKHFGIVNRIEKIMTEQHQASSLFPIKVLDEAPKK